MQRENKVIAKSLTAWIIALILLIPVSFVSAEQTKWWQQHDDGWFFYDDPEIVAKPKKEPVVEPKVEPKEEPKKEPPTEKPLLQSEQLKRKGEELLSNAVTEPTEENVKAYMVHNKQMLEMSDRFSLMWQAVLMKYPDLYKQVSTDGVAKNTETTIKSIREEAAVLFIYSSTCQYCQKMAPVIREFQDKYGFTVLPVTIDGIPLAELPNTLADNGIAERLGVETVPAIYLAFPSEDRLERVATGFLSLNELERKIFQLTQVQNLPANP